MTIRTKNWDAIDEESFDALIIGGGINGAAVFRELSQQGYKVLLIDQKDFASGTSQASTMMVWGGLLYLKNAEINTVYRFSKDRDDLLQYEEEHAKPSEFYYLYGKVSKVKQWLLYLGVVFYWFFSFMKRRFPKKVKSDVVTQSLTKKYNGAGIKYEEGFLRESDARYVLSLILEALSGSARAVNYVEAVDLKRDRALNQWDIQLKDKLRGVTTRCTAKLVINCAGVWTDRVNQQQGIQTPYKHLLSKGVTLNLRCPDNIKQPLVFETGHMGDTLCCVPWGSVCLWGPTEELIESIEDGFRVTKEDIKYLIDEKNKHLTFPTSIISVRCGIRPLVVDVDEQPKDKYPLEYSRRSHVHLNQDQGWISVYGGKISGNRSLGRKVERAVSSLIVPSVEKRNLKFAGARVHHQSEKEYVDIQWSVEHEFCCLLDDYLRRRTNIAQWIPRGGFGSEGEHTEWIVSLSQALPSWDGVHDHVDDYSAQVRQFDALLHELGENIHDGISE